MKKLFLLFAIAFSVATTSAQRASDMGVFNNDNDDWNHSSAFVETSLGAVVGDVSETGFGWGVGVGYRWHIANGICWDIVKAGMNTDVLNFTDALTVKALSGIRYNSPRIIGDKSLFVNAAFGYHLNTSNTDINGFAYEVGTGINLSKHISLGLSWEGFAASYDVEIRKGKKVTYREVNSHWGTIGVKLGVQF